VFHARSAKQAVILLFNHAVTRTTGRFEARTVTHLQLPTTVADQAGLLELSRDFGHTDAAHTEHVRQEFVCQ